MKYKMIVSDYDDTFIKEDFSYSEDLLSTVHRYIDKGGKFMIATGRMTEAIRPICKKMNLKGEVIGLQGALIQDIETGTEIESFPIYWEDALKVAEWIEKKRYYYHIYKSDNFMVKRITRYSKIYMKYTNKAPDKLFRNITSFIKENKFSPLKIMILTKPSKVQKIIDEMTKLFGDKVLINTSKKWIVEIVSINTSKGKAVERVAERNGIKREEIICIGDSANDVTMIEYAGLGVVVENGSDYAKQYADIIAPSNQNEGVGYIIRKYGLEEI